MIVKRIVVPAALRLLNRTVDAGGLTVKSGDDDVGGAVGGTAPLTSLTTDTPGRTVVRGGSVVTRGESFGDALV